MESLGSSRLGHAVEVETEDKPKVWATQFFNGTGEVLMGLVRPDRSARPTPLALLRSEGAQRGYRP